MSALAVRNRSTVGLRVQGGQRPLTSAERRALDRLKVLSERAVGTLERLLDDPDGRIAVRAAECILCRTNAHADREIDAHAGTETGEERIALLQRALDVERHELQRSRAEAVLSEAARAEAVLQRQQPALPENYDDAGTAIEACGETVSDSADMR